MSGHLATEDMAEGVHIGTYTFKFCLLVPGVLVEPAQ